MKKCLLVTYTLNLCFTTVALAGPNGGGGNPTGGSFGHNERMVGRVISDSSYRKNDDLFEDLQERRRAREERGFQRLKELKWKTGYTIPQHYRSDRYKVNPLSYNLPPSLTTQQWYKINSDFVLVDADNTIVEVR